MAKEFVIYCDESIEKGAYYSDFYGGVLVASKDLDNVVQRLENCKADLNLHQEVKWIKVTENYLEKYQNQKTGYYRNRLKRACFTTMFRYCIGCNGFSTQRFT